MNSLLSVCDPMFAIDYSSMIKATSSASGAKSFTSMIKGMTSSSLIDIDMDNEDLFGLNVSPNIYQNLFNENRVYSNYSSLIDKDFKKYNEFEGELSVALSKLYDSASKVLENGNSMLALINSKSFEKEILCEEGKLFLGEDFNLGTPVMCYQLKDDENIIRININDIDIDHASKAELSCYLAYVSMQDLSFPKELENIINLSNDKNEDNDSELLKSYAKNMKRFKDVYESYKIADEKADKENEENEKIDALFNLIDAINEMYRKYNEKERKEQEKQRRKK